MSETEIKNIMADARVEIMALRRRNDILSAKVDTMELLASINRPMRAESTSAMSVDVVWQLDNAVTAINQREAKPL